MSNFTKGDWYLIETEDGCELTGDAREGMVCIANIPHAYLDDLDKNEFEQEQLFNAKLLEASPRMYNVLKDIVDQFLDEFNTEYESNLLFKARRILESIDEN